jgi:hypothetical protein
MPADPEQPTTGAPPAELMPLEAHIVALRAQLAHHERVLLLSTGGLLVAAVALLLAARRGVRP